MSFDASLRLRRAARPAARGVARHARALSRARAKPLFVSRFALRAFLFARALTTTPPFPRLFSRRPQVHSAVVSRKAARVSHVVRAADGDARAPDAFAGLKPTKASAFKSMSNDELLAEMTAAKKMLFELRMRQSTRKEYKGHHFGILKTKIAQIRTVKREREVAEGVNKRDSRKMKRESAPRTCTCERDARVRGSSVGGYGSRGSRRLF